MPSVGTLGDPEQLELVGSGATTGRFSVRFGTEGPAADVVWLERAVRASVGAERVIAQDGPGLWRRSPWPVRDEIFDLAEPSHRSILVVGEGKPVAEMARWLGDDAQVPRLTRPALEAAAAVVFARPEEDALPAAAFAVLAARRVLVLRGAAGRFGLEAGVNHLAAETPAGMAELAVAATRHWEAFAALRAFGRIAAEGHRASVVYERLAYELGAEAGA